MRAFSLIRPEPHYRREAFLAGLRSAGYDARAARPQSLQRGDVVLMWNRYGENHDLAERAEAAGARVLVAENGYLGKDRDGRQYYALAEGGHNGSGKWPAGPDRFSQLGVELKPWRAAGEHVLVCPNRPFGMPGLAMSHNWVRDVTRKLAAATQRPVRVRPHPGNSAPLVPLERDLEGAWCVVIWASSAGVKALVAGIPVICESPWWICKGCAFGLAPSEWEAMEEAKPDYLDHNRRRAMERMAWAQWTLEEIASGEPFRRLLS